LKKNVWRTLHGDFDLFAGCRRHSVVSDALVQLTDVARCVDDHQTLTAAPQLCRHSNSAKT